MLRWVCLGFVGLGVGLPFVYGLAPFALYRDAVSTFVGDAALATDSPTLRLCLGMTGGSIAGKWMAHLAVVRLGMEGSTTPAWAWRATLSGLVGWFVVDSLSSLLAGAWANVVFVNFVPPLLVLPLLIFGFGTRSQSAAPPLRPALRVALIASVLGALSGLSIAFLGDGPLFGPWREALGAAHFGGALPDSGRALVRFFLGPIGGSTFGHFVLVAALVRHAPSMEGGERRALTWAAFSVLTWFLFDSALSLASGAAFIVWMVNVPALLLTVVPLTFAALTASPAPSSPSSPSVGAEA